MAKFASVIIKMMEAEHFGRSFTETFDDLIQTVSSIEDEQLNSIPVTGDWTAGQIVRHILMSTSGFIKLLNGPVMDTTRDPYLQVEKIQHDFLNFSIKNKSPDFVNPPQLPYKRDELLATLGRMKSRILDVIASHDLTKSCLLFEAPNYGQVTRIEGITFVTYHTQRHIVQLKTLIGTLSSTLPG